MFTLHARVIAAGFIEEIKSGKHARAGPDSDERISSLERLAALKEGGGIFPRRSSSGRSSGYWRS